MQTRGPEAFDIFCEALRHAGQDYLASLLTGDDKLTSVQIIQQTLRFHLGIDCQEVQRAWRKFLLSQQLSIENNYILPNLVDKENGNRQLKKYEEILGKETRPTSNRFIVIEGRPGVGKSTYVSKLVETWVNRSNEFVIGRFELIFLIRMNELKSLSRAGPIRDTDLFRLFHIDRK